MKIHNEIIISLRNEKCEILKARCDDRESSQIINVYFLFAKILYFLKK